MQRLALASSDRKESTLRDRAIAGTCIAISKTGPRPSISMVIYRSRVGRKGFYEEFAHLEDCVKAALSHSLDEVFRCIDAGEDWASWFVSHRPEASVVAWGFAIDPDAIEIAISRAAELLPIDGATAIGVVGGLYSTVAARLRAGRFPDPATVRALEDFVSQYTQTGRR